MTRSCDGPFGAVSPALGPVLVHRRAEQHPEDPVTVPLRVREPLQHQEAAALPADEPVGPGVERLAPPVRGQHARLLEHPGHLGNQDGVHSPGERQVHLPALQPHRRLVDGHEGRRTCGVHRDRGPLPPQREGDPSDGGGGAVAGGAVKTLRRVVEPGDRKPPVVVVHDPDVHPAATPAQRVRIHPGILERLPADLEQQPLLRVQQVRLHGRDAEEPGVEPVEARQVGAERAGIAVRLPRDESLRPAPRHRIAARRQLSPERRRVGTAREAARHPHHRDALRRLPAGPLAGPRSPERATAPRPTARPARRAGAGPVAPVSESRTPRCSARCRRPGKPGSTGSAAPPPSANPCPDRRTPPPAAGARGAAAANAPPPGRIRRAAARGPAPARPRHGRRSRRGRVRTPLPDRRRVRRRAPNAAPPPCRRPTSPATSPPGSARPPGAPPPAPSAPAPASATPPPPPGDPPRSAPAIPPLLRDPTTRPTGIACPGSPSARRCSANWSRNAFAAAWFA